MIKEACITEKKKEYAPTHESLANISSKTDIVCNTKWCESDNTTDPQCDYCRR